jgi:hypothetical protein
VQAGSIIIYMIFREVLKRYYYYYLVSKENFEFWDDVDESGPDVDDGRGIEAIPR